MFGVTKDAVLAAITDTLVEFNQSYVEDSNNLLSVSDPIRGVSAIIESVEYLSLIMLLEDNLRKVCKLRFDLIEVMERNENIVSLNNLSDYLTQASLDK